MMLRKFVLAASAFAALALPSFITAQAAAPDAARYVASMGNVAEAPPRQSRSPFEMRAKRLLLPIRDIGSGNGGGGNGCWNACFTDFDECLGVRTKNLCVSRVKTCLETCDRLSHRPGM